MSRMRAASSSGQTARTVRVSMEAELVTGSDMAVAATFPLTVSKRALTASVA
jgi:hypothetical protein